MIDDNVLNPRILDHRMRTLPGGRRVYENSMENKISTAYVSLAIELL